MKGQDVPLERVLRLLHIPEGKIKHGVLLLKLNDGRTVLRVTAFYNWLRMEELQLEGDEEWPGMGE